MKPLPRNLALGQAGVYRVLSECLLRGVNAAIPVVDTGVDIHLSDGRRIQVKAARLARRQSKGKVAPSLGPAYRWTLSVTCTDNHWQSGRRAVKPGRPYAIRRYSDEVDLLVFWGVDEDRFWLVPAALCDGRINLNIYPKRHAGVVHADSFISRIRDHEDRWDLITNTSTAVERPQLIAVGE